MEREQVILAVSRVAHERGQLVKKSCKQSFERFIEKVRHAKENLAIYTCMAMEGTK